MELLRVLLAVSVIWSLVQLSSSNTECPDPNPNAGEGQVPVKINCTVHSNGTLSTSWAVTDTNNVELIYMDYTCTISGVEQAGNLYSWITADSDVTVVNPLPSISSTYPTTSAEPTCYIDGCYNWTPDFSTWMIPTVTCSAAVISGPSESFTNPLSKKVMSSVPTSTATTPNDQHDSVISGPSESFTNPLSKKMMSSVPTSTVTTPNDQHDSGGRGLQPYMWTVLTVLAIAMAICLVLFIALLIIRKRKRKLWLYHNAEDTNLLPENEPSIDPYSHVKSEYYDTETIVDPLEEGHVTCERLEETKMDYNGTTFLVSLNQQAGDSDDHSSSESGSSESTSVLIESGSNKGVESDPPACKQTAERTSTHHSDSEKESPSTDSTVHVEPALHTTPLTRTHGTSTAAGRLGEISSFQLDKTIDNVISGQQDAWESTKSQSPDYVPSSEYTVSSGNGTSSVISSSDIEDAETNNAVTEEATSCTNKDDRVHTNNQALCISPDSHNSDDRTSEINPNSLSPGDNVASEGQRAAKRSALKLPMLAGSGVPLSRSKDGELDRAKVSGCDQVHQRYQDDYVSSSDYTSSEYSNEQTRTGNSIVGYLADIEDVENSSLQSDLESDSGTHDGGCGTSHDPEDENRNTTQAHSYDAGDIVELNISLTNKLPKPVASKRRPQQLVPVDDDDGLYYAMVYKSSLPESPCSGYIDMNQPLPESPCSGYIDMGLLSVQSNQDEEELYEDMSRQTEHTRTENHDYVELSSLPQNRHQQVQNYKYETTV